MKNFIDDMLNAHLVPYVATSEQLLPHLDLSLFKGHEVVKLLENPEERNFHEAYLVSNSLAFGNPELKMPNWVYIDCVLMQSAVVGFAIPVSKAPDSLIEHYERDPYVDVEKLDYIPVSGQIAALGIDGQSLVGFSLFSLRRQLSGGGLSDLAIGTKYAAMSVYRAAERKKFLGISQYDNAALKIHARFGDKMYIDRTTMPLHPLRDMSFTYSMKVHLDEERIFAPTNKNNDQYDFLLKADDLQKKLEMQELIQQGHKFYITQPIQIKKEDGIYLPICEEK